ncbi:MAG: hypothetical protein LUC37_02770 [Prevotella sp.]|nr:hypothetical protein [Prevotella sp.]
MTKKEMFALLDTIVDDSSLENKTEMHDFIKHEIELLSRKSSSKGMTKTQKENEKLKNEIFDSLLESGGFITVTELQKRDENLDQYSNQKITALLSQLIKDGRAKKEVVKKKSFYSAVIE